MSQHIIRQSPGAWFNTTIRPKLVAAGYTNAAISAVQNELGINDPTLTGAERVQRLIDWQRTLPKAE